MARQKRCDPLEKKRLMQQELVESYKSRDTEKTQTC